MRANFHFLEEPSLAFSQENRKANNIKNDTKRMMANVKKSKKLAN